MTLSCMHSLSLSSSLSTLASCLIDQKTHISFVFFFFFLFFDKIQVKRMLTFVGNDNDAEPKCWNNFILKIIVFYSTGTSMQMDYQISSKCGASAISNIIFWKWNSSVRQQFILLYTQLWFIHIFFFIHTHTTITTF